MMGQEYEKLVENGDASDKSTDRMDSETKGHTRRGLTMVVVALAFVTGAALILLYLTICSKLFIKQDFVTFEYPVEGSSGVVEEVFSSVKDNYVQYFIERSPSDKSWILDDFNTELETIRSEEGGRSTCYVSQLDLAEAMAPTAKQPQPVLIKERDQELYSRDEDPVEDRAFLGPIAGALCINASVYWIHPLAVSDTAILGAGSPEYDLASSEEQTSDDKSPSDSAKKDGRWKRGISSCRTSCCWQVCCCNTRQFTWESSEHITCRHVCDKCSSAYRPVIRQLC
jgi:hypothetical protein